MSAPTKSWEGGNVTMLWQNGTPSSVFIWGWICDAYPDCLGGEDEDEDLCSSLVSLTVGGLF